MPLHPGTFSGPLQRLLEGSGWDVLRPTVDFVLLCIGVVAALGGVDATLHVSAEQAPLLALPPLVMLLFYLRGLYRTRLRALILDGVVPVVSAVSVAAMAVAGRSACSPTARRPSSPTWCRPGCSRCSRSASGASPCRSPSAGRARAG